MAQRRPRLGWPPYAPPLLAALLRERRPCLYTLRMVLGVPERDQASGLATASLERSRLNDSLKHTRNRGKNNKSNNSFNERHVLLMIKTTTSSLHARKSTCHHVPSKPSWQPKQRPLLSPCYLAYHANRHCTLGRNPAVTHTQLHVTHS
jgi:hypothetical protein